MRIADYREEFLLWVYPRYYHTKGVPESHSIQGVCTDGGQVVIRLDVDGGGPTVAELSRTDIKAKFACLARDDNSPQSHEGVLLASGIRPDTPYEQGGAKRYRAKRVHVLSRHSEDHAPLAGVGRLGHIRSEAGEIVDGYITLALGEMEVAEGSDQLLEATANIMNRENPDHGLLGARLESIGGLHPVAREFPRRAQGRARAEAPSDVIDRVMAYAESRHGFSWSLRGILRFHIHPSVKETFLGEDGVEFAQEFADEASGSQLLPVIIGFSGQELGIPLVHSLFLGDSRTKVRDARSEKWSEIRYQTPPWFGLLVESENQLEERDPALEEVAEKGKPPTDMGRKGIAGFLMKSKGIDRND